MNAKREWLTAPASDSLSQTLTCVYRGEDQKVLPRHEAAHRHRNGASL